MTHLYMPIEVVMNSGEEPSSKFTQTNVGANGEFRSSKYFIRISAVEIHKSMLVD